MKSNEIDCHIIVALCFKDCEFTGLIVYFCIVVAILLLFSVNNILDKYCKFGNFR